MDTLQAIQERHSVRAYTDQKIEGAVKEQLEEIVASINEESGLHIMVRYDDPEGFDSRLAHYGKFKNVRNYIMLVGPKAEDINEKCGYYGEKLVLEAQKLGLNTCWVALTFNKKLVKKLVPKEEKLCMVIALGYGENPGHVRSSKSMNDVASGVDAAPAWFKAGVEAALLAPTAVNQQKFKITLKDDVPNVLISGIGSYTKVDLGIVKYHFEIGSGKSVMK